MKGIKPIPDFISIIRGEFFMRFDQLLSPDQLVGVVLSSMRAHGAMMDKSKLRFIPVPYSAFLSGDEYRPGDPEQVNKLRHASVIRPLLKGMGDGGRGDIVNRLHLYGMGTAAGSRGVTCGGLYDDRPKTGKEAVAALTGLKPELIEVAPASAAGFQNLQLVAAARCMGAGIADLVSRRPTRKTLAYIVLREAHKYIQKNGAPADHAIGEEYVAAKLLGAFTRGRGFSEVFSFLPAPVVEPAIFYVRNRVALSMAGFDHFTEDEYFAAILLASTGRTERTTARSSIPKELTEIPGFKGLLDQLANVEETSTKEEKAIEARIHGGGATARERNMSKVIGDMMDAKFDFSDPVKVLPAMAAFLERERSFFEREETLRDMRLACDVNVPGVVLPDNTSFDGVSGALFVVMAELYLQAVKRFMPALYASAMPARSSQVVGWQKIPPPSNAKN